MRFHAELNNAKPPGLIHRDGMFGPWNQDAPADTPVCQGQLDRIEVHGTTEVPEFSLTLGGRPMHLRTDFEAIVDGTNGNTNLHPVHALLGNTAFEVSGSIERNALEMHKEIDLEARSKETGLGDFLRLAINSPHPPMKGVIGFDTMAHSRSIGFNSTARLFSGKSPA